LVEIIVAVFVIALFSSIIIANFPAMEKRFSLTRVAYNLAQDLRTAEGMGLSGTEIENSLGGKIKAKGYGVYIDLTYGDHKKYKMYADVDGDEKYSLPSDVYCQDMTGLQTDCIIKEVDINQDEPHASIKEIKNTNSQWACVNFSPPSPKVNIANISVGQTGIEIVLSLDDDEAATRSVLANTGGLIEIK